MRGDQFMSLREESKLTGPMTLNSWTSAAQGDPSGLWLLSTMATLSSPVVRLGRACKHRDGRRAARRALLQLRRGPGLDHRQSPRGVLVGGRRHGARLAGQPG